jgi:hypothetical protein
MRLFISRLVLAVAAAALVAPATASAVTVDEIVALSRAGVTDTVILALIDRDKTIFTLEPDQLVSLKSQGLSEPVIIAMLKSGREEGDRAAQAAADLQTAMYLAERSPGPEVLVLDRGSDRTSAYGAGVYPGAAIAYPVPYGTSYGGRRGRVRSQQAPPMFVPYAAPPASNFVAPANIPVIPPTNIPVIPPVSRSRSQLESQLPTQPRALCRAEIRGANSAFPLTTIVACPDAMQRPR